VRNNGNISNSQGSNSIGKQGSGKSEPDKADTASGLVMPKLTPSQAQDLIVIIFLFFSNTKKTWNFCSDKVETRLSAA
jgi:hypothetical protein